MTSPLRPDLGGQTPAAGHRRELIINSRLGPEDYSTAAFSSRTITGRSDLLVPRMLRLLIAAVLPTTLDYSADRSLLFPAVSKHLLS